MKSNHVIVQGVHLDEVKSFRYLRDIIIEDNRSENERRSRIPIGRSAFLKSRTIQLWKENEINVKPKIILL